MKKALFGLVLLAVLFFVCRWMLQDASHALQDHAADCARVGGSGC